MRFSREWCMPNKNTFSIKPIGFLIEKYLKESKMSCDPCCNGTKLATVTNDLNPDVSADYHMDAVDFLKTRKDGEFDLVLADFPYSPRQISECYRKLGKTVSMTDTQASYWTNIKKELSRVVCVGGVTIWFGWNTSGTGKQYGFEIEEILLVCHGGAHNDTIVTVDRKVK